MPGATGSAPPEALHLSHVEDVRSMFVDSMDCPHVSCNCDSEMFWRRGANAKSTRKDGRNHDHVAVAGLYIRARAVEKGGAKGMTGLLVRRLVASHTGLKLLSAVANQDS